MPDFVTDPALPRAAASVLLGKKYLCLLGASLERLGIEPVPIPDNPNIDPRLSGHADLSVFSYGRGELLLASYLSDSSFADTLKEIGCKINFCREPQRSLYPFDAALNVCYLGNHVILNKNTAAREIVNYFTSRDNIQLLETRQGYTGCSVCVVSENAIITSDRGIAHRLEASHGVDVLLIEPGHIDLPGFPYGFIGGSAFLISNTTMAFTGRLDRHPDRMRIEEFLYRRGISAVYLTELPIFDMGGAIPLTEKPSD